MRRLPHTWPVNRIQMFDTGNITFLIELMTAEVIFLYAFPRRTRFPLKCVASVAVCMLLAYLFPMPAGIKFTWYYSLIRFLTIFFLSFAAALVCFRARALVTLSACSAGYAVQHIAFHSLNLAEYIPFDYSAVTFDGFNIIMLPVYAVIYVVMWLLFGRMAAKNTYYENYDVRLAVTAFTMVLICVGITRIAREEAGGVITISNSLYSVLCCVLALVMQFNLYRIIRLATENATVRSLRESDKKMYEITKSTIEAINIKCHDLKHQIYSSGGMPAGERAEIKSLLRIYDNSVHTGNNVLDVVLMDNALRYDTARVRFTFMGDASCLAPVSETDLASLLGNIVSNAAEAAVRLQDEGKRVVELRVEGSGDFVTITERNYFEGEMHFKDGFPVSTKDGAGAEHGFGLKSIAHCAKKYGGGIRVSAENGVFTLVVYMLAAAQNA